MISIRLRKYLAYAATAATTIALLAACGGAAPPATPASIEQPKPTEAPIKQPTPTEVPKPTEAPIKLPTPTEMPKPTEAPATTEMVLAKGAFERVMYGGSGEATIVKLPDGALELRLKDFKVDNGPALYVYLSPIADIPKTSGQGDVPGSIPLAPLQALAGDQVYVLPVGTDVGTVKAILIWCKEFSVGFVSAPLAAL